MMRKLILATFTIGLVLSAEVAPVDAEFAHTLWIPLTVNQPSGIQSPSTAQPPTVTPEPSSTHYTPTTSPPASATPIPSDTPRPTVVFPAGQVAFIDALDTLAPSVANQRIQGRFLRYEWLPAWSTSKPLAVVVSDAQLGDVAIPWTTDVAERITIALGAPPPMESTPPAAASGTLSRTILSRIPRPPAHGLQPPDDFSFAEYGDLILTSGLASGADVHSGTPLTLTYSTNRNFGQSLRVGLLDWDTVYGDQDIDRRESYELRVRHSVDWNIDLLAHVSTRIGEEPRWRQEVEVLSEATVRTSPSHLEVHLNPLHPTVVRFSARSGGQTIWQLDHTVARALRVDRVSAYVLETLDGYTSTATSPALWIEQPHNPLSIGEYIAGDPRRREEVALRTLPTESVRPLANLVMWGSAIRDPLSDYRALGHHLSGVFLGNQSASHGGIDRRVTQSEISDTLESGLDVYHGLSADMLFWDPDFNPTGNGRDSVYAGSPVFEMIAERASPQYHIVLTGVFGPKTYSRRGQATGFDLHPFIVDRYRHAYRFGEYLNTLLPHHSYMLVMPRQVESHQDDRIARVGELIGQMRAGAGRDSLIDTVVFPSTWPQALIERTAASYDVDVGLRGLDGIDIPEALRLTEGTAPIFTSIIDGSRDAPPALDLDLIRDILTAHDQLPGP